MSRTLEPILLSLLPTYSTDLPQPLLELAASLLAQSRNNAGTLKAEEEVARSYACAHIACERLKISLDLPPIQPRPPIHPRIYKRLYTHLDNVLPANSVGKSGRIRTPSSKMRDSGIFGSMNGKRTPSRATPNKDESLARFRSPATKGDGTPTKSTSTGRPPVIPAKRKAGGVISALPAWIRPTIQLLCKELDEERIGRTVLAGMQTIAAPQGRPTKDEWVNGNLTPLVAAVYLLVSSQLYVLEQGAVDKKNYAQKRKSILDVLERAQETVKVKGMDEDELWIGWTDVGTKDLDAAATKIVESGWQKDEWFESIKVMAKKPNQPGEEDGSVDEEANDNDEGRFSEKLHMQKGDTMFQTRWDMTDQKREEYRKWKTGILQQIEEIERSGAAEVDASAA